MEISTLGSALLLVDPAHGKPARSHSEDLPHSVRRFLSQCRVCGEGETRRTSDVCCGPGKGAVLFMRGAFVLIFLLNLQIIEDNTTLAFFASTKVKIKDLQACLEQRPQEKEELPHCQKLRIGRKLKLSLALRCQNLPRGNKKILLY